MCWLAVAHGATRATFDIDIVPRWETHNLDALAGALRAVNARLRVPGATVEVPLDSNTLRHYEVSTWRTDHGDINVVVGTPKRTCGQLASFDELAARAHARHAFGVAILIADLDDIIESSAHLSRASG